MAKKGGDMVQSSPVPPGNQLTNEKIIRIAEVLPKEQGVRAPHQSVQSGCTALERQLLEKQ